MLDNALLRHEKLTGMIQEFKPEELAFKNSGILPKVDEMGLTAEWDIEVTARGILGFVGDHSPAKPQPLNSIKKQFAKLGVIRVSKNLPASIFQQIRQPGTDAEQRNAATQIAREEKEFSAAFDRTEEFLIASALQGSISTTVDDLAISAIDYGIPAANKFTYNSGDPTLNVGDWLDESTDIVDAVRRMKLASRVATGYALKKVWISDLVQQAILKNERVIAVMRSTTEGVRSLEEGSMGRFMGLDWVVVDHNYKNSAGTVTRYLPANTIVATPAPSTEWGFMRYGSLFVPNNTEDGFVEVGGRHSYAGIQKNPPGLTLYAGLAALPIIRKPGVIVRATVTAA